MLTSSPLTADRACLVAGGKPSEPAVFCVVTAALVSSAAVLAGVAVTPQDCFFVCRFALDLGVFVGFAEPGA